MDIDPAQRIRASEDAISTDPYRLFTTWSPRFHSSPGCHVRGKCQYLQKVLFETGTRQSSLLTLTIPTDAPGACPVLLLCILSIFFSIFIQILELYYNSTAEAETTLSAYIRNTGVLEIFCSFSAIDNLERMPENFFPFPENWC